MADWHRRMMRLAGARLLALSLAPWMAAVAQVEPAGLDSADAAAPARTTCNGDTVTAIDIRVGPRSTPGLEETTLQAARVLGLPYTATRPEVIRAYLRVAVGRVCTETNRRESERLLRAQPFIAAAEVRAIVASPGRVRLQVNVVDGIRPVAAIRVSHGSLASLMLGTQNLSGRGLALQVHGERDAVYRNGFGLRAVKYGMFGRSDFLSVEAQRTMVDGGRLSLELAEPYLTDLQVRAFHARTSMVSGYENLVRPRGEDASQFVRRTFYDFGWVTRIRRANGRGPVGLVGAALLGEDVRTKQDFVILSDTGIVSLPTRPRNKAYPSFNSTRIAAIAGMRALRFQTVRGFDALTAEQDVGIGAQFDLLVGGALRKARSGDILIAADLYAGAGSASSFLVVRAQAESRGASGTHRFDGLVASGRLAWYANPSGARSRQASVEASAVRGLGFPMQLTFEDPNGGLPGFVGSSFAGGRRMVARLEERHMLRTFGRHADVAVSLFATAGRLWAGDVPYGRTTPVRASAGVSVLGAYPAGGLRTFRVDLAVPFNPERGGARVEVRLTAYDRTSFLWREPNDVARARSGAVPARLMTW